MTTRTSQLIAELVDRVSGPAGNISKSLRGINDASKQTPAQARANPLTASGSVAMQNRLRAAERSATQFQKRYEIAAAATTRAWSVNGATIAAAAAAQGRQVDGLARRYELASTRMQRSAAATAAAVAASAPIVRPGRPPLRPGLVPNQNTSGVSPEERARQLAARNPQGGARAADALAAAAAARAAQGGGDGDDDNRRNRRRVGGLAGGAAGGGSLAAVWALARRRAEEERDMRLTAIAANIPESQIPKKISELRAIQAELNLSYEQLKKGFDEQITLGKSWDEATEGLRTIARASMAYNAPIERFARLQYQIGENFNLKTPAQQRRALEIVAGLGRVGQFEIPDMADKLPSLAPRFKAGGLTGEQGLMLAGGMLQRIRTRTGTSAEAATRMERLLDEVNSPAVAKRFKGAGIDYDSEMKRRTDAGMSRIEAYLDLLRKGTGGDENRVARFITNTYARQAAQALLDLPALEKTVAEGRTAAQATLSDDSERVIQDSKAQIDALGFALSDMGAELGRLAVKMTPFVERVAAGLRWLTGNQAPDQERLAFLRKQYEQGGAITRLVAGRSISDLEKRLGIGRDFTIGNPGRFTPTGLPTTTFDSSRAPEINRRIGEGINDMLRRHGSPLSGQGGVVGPARLHEGALGAAGAFEHLRRTMDDVDGKTARPDVDTTKLERALEITNQLIRALSQVDAAASRISGEVTRRLERDLRTGIRALYADYGLEESG